MGKGAQADVLRANLEVTAAEERSSDLRGRAAHGGRARSTRCRRCARARRSRRSRCRRNEPSPAERRGGAARPGETEAPPSPRRRPRSGARRRSSAWRVSSAGPTSPRRATTRTAMDYEDLAGASVSLNAAFLPAKRLKETAGREGGRALRRAREPRDGQERDRPRRGRGLRRARPVARAGAPLSRLDPARRRRRTRAAAAGGLHASGRWTS